MTQRTMQSVMVTGGAGFIGSNFIRGLLAERPDVRVLNLDALTYAGNLESTADFAEDARYAFVKEDIGEGERVLALIKERKIDAIFNFAAESHVDRSILSSREFIRTNVLGTQTLLDAARETGVGLFVQISTDEVYGSLGPGGYFTETTPLAPNSPYSSSKAGADLLCRAAYKTFGFPVVITRCSNNYGPYQFPEKLIPLMITNAVKGEPLPVYGDGMQVRDWIHVRDHCAAILAAAERGRPGEVYNVGASNERPNLEVVKSMLKILGKPENLIHYVKDRPGHDRRYAIDSSKAKAELGWAPTIDFETGLAETIEWYLNNREWSRRVLTGEYQQYYEKNYASKFGA